MLPREQHDLAPLSVLGITEGNPAMLHKSSELVPGHMQLNVGFVACEHDLHPLSGNFQLFEFVNPYCCVEQDRSPFPRGKRARIFANVNPEKHSVNSTFVGMAS